MRLASVPAVASSLPRMVGGSESISALRERLPAIARAQRTTLITGPTGSGKDVIARMLHAMSPRAELPYVTVHCAALPETLVEAELFGHSRGAFTGATAPRAGLIRSASQGTIFLDEIDSLTPTAQAKLLRFLETGEYRAVGSDKSAVSDAWVIAATNQDLRAHVARSSFRSDLLYRLEVVKIDVPALKDRRCDILPLARHFLAEAGDGKRSLSEEACAQLECYDWPGNIRELKHRVESAALLSERPVLDCLALGLPSTMLPELPRLDPVALGLARPSPTSLESELWRLVERDRMSLAQALALCERLVVQTALRENGNNRTRAAERLGIHVRTIYKKLGE